MIQAVADTALDALEAELTAGGIVTRVLERRVGGPVRAERVAADGGQAPAATRARLLVGADDRLALRRVRLFCGDTLVSEADNWFVPGRLTPAMRAALDAGDTPFGRVIEPLAPRRETLDCTRLAGDPILRLHALVVAGDAVPLAEVTEWYRAAAVGRGDRPA